ncbi:MAG TPA: CAP domain-containing protein [Rubrobacteraceae bacterium]|nr:CAP domain-containing protein [Rubrobacteraceae bacterium]
MGDARVGYRWLFLAVVAFMLAGTLLYGRSAVAASPYDSEELQFLSLINEYRQNNGLQPMILSDTLTLTSGHHDEDMAKYGFFAHDTVRSSYYPAGSKPWDRMAKDGYGYNTYRGENLAVGYETAEEAFQAWRNSPAHNAAMLDGHYKVIGIARLNAPGSEWGWYWTTDFGGVVDPSAHGANEAPKPKDPAPEPTGTQAASPEPKKPDPPAPAKKSAPSRDQGGIENGSFEDGTVWRQDAKDGADLILPGGVARLGDYADGRDDLSQVIKVTRGAKVSYRIKVISEERKDPSDHLKVRLTDTKGKKLAVLKVHNASDPAGWQRVTLDVSRYSGRTVRLDFSAVMDDQRLTTFLLDDVALKAR